MRLPVTNTDPVTSFHVIYIKHREVATALHFLNAYSSPPDGAGWGWCWRLGFSGCYMGCLRAVMGCLLLPCRYTVSRVQRSTADGGGAGGPGIHLNSLNSSGTDWRWPWHWPIIGSINKALGSKFEGLNSKVKLVFKQTSKLWGSRHLYSLM